MIKHYVYTNVLGLNIDLILLWKTYNLTTCDPDKFGRTPRVEGKFGRTPSVEGKFCRTHSVEGKFGRTHSIEGKFGRTHSVKGKFGRTHSVEGKFDRTPSVEGKFDRTHSVEGKSVGSACSGPPHTPWATDINHPHSFTFWELHLEIVDILKKLSLLGRLR